MKKEKPKLSSAEKISRQIEKLAQREALPIVGPDRGKILPDEVRKAMPLHVLEVDTWWVILRSLWGKSLGKMLR